MHPTSPDLSTSASTRAYLPTLDGWRALAIGATILHHSLLTFMPPGMTWRFDPQQLGVLVFFVISGFLIATLLLEERVKRGRINLVSFYVRRVFRIFPPPLVFLATITALSRLGIINVPDKSVFACLIISRNFIEGDWYTMHFWSLSIEEQFYLVMPIALIAVRSEAGALRLFVAFFFSILAWKLLNRRLSLSPGLWSRTDAWATYLIWGVATALVVRHDSWRVWLTRRTGSVPTILLAATVLTTYFSQVPLKSLVLPLAISAMLVSTVFAPCSVLSRILESSPMRWLGQISYSLYVWQQVFLVPNGQPYPFPFDPRRHPYLPLVGAVALATCSRYILEKPMIELGRRYLSWRAGIGRPEGPNPTSSVDR